MGIVTSWTDLVDTVEARFPEVDRRTLMANEGDIAALIMHR